jgi:hypothetical protein
MTKLSRPFSRKIARKKSALSDIARDVLLAAIELEVFNIRQLAEYSGHTWGAVKRLIDIWSMKDTLSVGILPTRIPRHYRITVIAENPRKAINKTKIRNVLRRR